jgi:hypothetical protein
MIVQSQQHKREQSCESNSGLIGATALSRKSSLAMIAVVTIAHWQAIAEQTRSATIGSVIAESLAK